MREKIEPVEFVLKKPADAEALQALRLGVSRALRSGAKSIEIDIDAVGALEVKVISTLILLLRGARERGATVTLRVGQPEGLETLRRTGLDKIFQIRPPAEPGAPISEERAPAYKRRRLVAAIATGLFVLGALAASAASAAPEMSALELVRSVVAQNAEMESYQAQVSVDFHLRTFPYVGQHLDGTTYFKRPDNFEVAFQKVPSYAKGFERLYSDIDDPTSWERRFDISLAGEREVDGHRDVVVRLVQKVRGMIDHQDVAIDPVASRIDAMEWHYYNGGVIAMSQEFQNVGRFTVLAKQHATIRIPYVHAAADATYSDYRTNVAIDDSVFTREKH